jgi:hypothetical protein
MRRQAENTQAERQQTIPEKRKKAERHHEEGIFSGIERIFFGIMTGVQQDCFCFRREDRFFL